MERWTLVHLRQQKALGFQTPGATPNVNQNSSETVQKYIPEEKFTTVNDGKKIDVRGTPGGNWYKKNTPSKSSVDIPSRSDLSEINTGLQKVQPSSYYQNQRGVQHTTNNYRGVAAEDVCIMKEEPEVQVTSVMKKTMQQSSGVIGNKIGYSVKVISFSQIDEII
ncbi:hypothetical protein CHS0354_032088 [Potamilus streckersoni]|uniref:Uncharacterized protein n=1 Tax=Potamilus streckersoni TaxID=2493646 RepID=A0AAE0TL43_9BIVA|nr:hypothetical protein CHS0354_032088 [Potamilus streckersoni]